MWNLYVNITFVTSFDVFDQSGIISIEFGLVDQWCYIRLDIWCGKLRNTHLVSRLVINFTTHMGELLIIAKTL